MTIRTRVGLAGILVSWIPLAGLAFGLRTLVVQRLTDQFRDRVTALAGVVRQDIEDERVRIAAGLDAISNDVRQDNRLRALLTEGGDDRSYLLDYGGSAMRVAGFTVLQVQDASGRIVSSGHFRNEYDRLDPAVPRDLGSFPSGALMRARTPEGPRLSLVALDSFAIGPQLFTVVGGIDADRAVRVGTRGEAMAVTIALPGEPVSLVDAPGVMAIEIPLPLIGDDDGIQSARVRVTHDVAALTTLIASVDAWFLGAAVLAAVLSVLAAIWLAALIVKPLSQLAAQTAQVDLDRLNISFDNRRSDEVGALSKLLQAMTDRLLRSRETLQEAERRAAVGELARQVNHDIKNGLTPIRNVFRHFSEVADAEPERLVDVYRERRDTVTSSIEYLENLSANYARLSPTPNRVVCDLNGVIAAAVGTGGRRDGVAVRLELSDSAPAVNVDPLMLRRIVENLVSNAADATNGGGTITVATGVTAGMVHVAVRDTGAGMTREQLSHAFDTFYTTKDRGTGLGLSIVRRLMTDMNGSIRMDTEPGVGTTVYLEFPVEVGR